MKGTHRHSSWARSLSTIVVLGAMLAVAAVSVACGGGTASVTTTEVLSSRWAELNPGGTLPQPRSGATMVYDPAGAQVIMFGGWDADTDFGDTWAYDPEGGLWADLAPAGDLPAPRALYQLVLEPDSGNALLFGGTSDAGRYGDTWTYDPIANSWNQAAGAGAPQARSAHAMVFDSSAGKAVLFGGVGDAGRFGDTWTYDAVTDAWTALTPGGSTPSARSGHAMVFDPAQGVSIMFGGYDGADFLNDTWAYDAAADAWTKLEPSGELPSPRGNHRMVYDPESGLVLMFGGSDGDMELDELWAYAPKANSWTEMLTSGTVPPGREEHAMVYCPETSRVLVFGGFDRSDTDLNDLWAFTFAP